MTVSTVTGAFGEFSAVHPGPPVRQKVGTDLVSWIIGRNAARMYLPEIDSSNGWECEGFTWRIDPASQTKLATMVPDPFSTDPPECYRYPVVVAPIPTTYNPTGDRDRTVGQLGGLSLVLVKRRLVATFQLRRRVAPSYDDGSADVASWDEAQIEFPTSTWADIDPDLTWYDVRLVRKL